ncbi:MAG: Rab family GTPase [Promethearchaeia archaeon]
MYDKTFKIVIFGDAGCGKAYLTQRFLTNLFVSDSRMTIGVDFEVKSVEVESKKVKLQIWDFGGEERFRFLLPTYVRGAKGGLFFYDITNYSSLAHIDDWLTVIKKEIKNEDHFPIIAVGLIPDLNEDQKREFDILNKCIYCRRELHQPGKKYTSGGICIKELRFCCECYRRFRGKSLDDLSPSEVKTIQKNIKKDSTIGDASPIDVNEREVPAEEAIRIAKSRDLDGFIECNIRTGENIETAFKGLTSLMLERALY